MNSLIDSHCHLYYEPFVNNLERTLKDCKKNNVTKLLSISVDLTTSKKNIELSKKFNEIFCTIGIHPNEAEKSSLDDIHDLEFLYKSNKKILAIGEIGLDFFRNNNNECQTNFFEKQIELALKLNLPIIIHTRNAENETLDILKKYKNNNLRFVIHCFSGSKNFANEIINLNGMISFSGIITFKNANELRDICKDIPLSNILIETDSPYLSPHPLRGKTNHPANVKYVANEISIIKKVSIDYISKITSENFNKFFI